MKAAILTYHSQNIAGHETGNNDHVALAADIEALHQAGTVFVSLSALVKGLFLGGNLPGNRPLVCLTFDDGCNFDVETIDYPGFGLQTGFLQIMEQFVERHGETAQPGLHATSFVIADPAARKEIDRKSLFGTGLISDDWWRSANKHPLFTIGNHGWDHNHPDLEKDRYNRGGFEVVDKYEFCDQQVVEAARLIETISDSYPTLFAYPFGESSRYMREDYFPNHIERHQTIAAMGTDPGMVTNESPRWNLPRYVCGRDWLEPEGLLKTLGY